MSNLSTALIITALGMGLVFLMIVLLWALMAILVRLAATHEPKRMPGTNNDTKLATDRKRRAAAGAVAAALILSESLAEPHEFPLPPTALVSAWQAVMRSEILKKRGQKR